MRPVFIGNPRTMMFGTNKGSAIVARLLPADSVGIELGVWKGDTAARFLATGRVRELHLVDAWSEEAMEGEPGWRDRYSCLAPGGDFSRVYDRVFCDVCARFADDPRVHLHRQTTRAFFARWGARPVDWVYVDAGHSFADALHDITASLAVAARVFGDDYGNKPGVTRALDELARSGKVDLRLLGGNQWEAAAVRKRNCPQPSVASGSG